MNFRYHLGFIALKKDDIQKHYLREMENRIQMSSDMPYIVKMIYK